MTHERGPEMRRRRFEDLVVSVATSRSGKRGLALPASIGVHAAILGAVVVAPLLTSSDLPPAVQAKPAPIPDFLVHVTPPAPTKGGPAPTLAPTRAPRPRAETPLDSPSLEP